MKASSILEGSFYAFERALHGFPRTYVGVVQCHMIKYGMKTCEEKQAAIRDKMIAFDEEISSSRTHAERECAKIFSHAVTDEFKSNNARGQDCISMHNVVDEEQSSRGVSDSRTIHLRSTLNYPDLPKPRILECIDGIWYCSC